MAREVKARGSELQNHLHREFKVTLGYRRKGGRGREEERKEKKKGVLNGDETE